MKKNVGSLDRNIRLLTGSILILAGLFVPLRAEWRSILFAVGAVAFVTGFSGL